MIALGIIIGSVGCTTNEQSAGPRSCSANEECNADEACVAEAFVPAKTCEPGCRSDADCTAGEHCSPDAVCGTGCNGNDDCAAGEWCEDVFSINLGRTGPTGACRPNTINCGPSTCEKQTTTEPEFPVVLGACCTADQTCGLDVVFPLTSNESCQAREQPGELDATCESHQDLLGVEYPGCRRPDGTCGVQVDGVLGASLGCVPPTAL